MKVNENTDNFDLSKQHNLEEKLINASQIHQNQNEGCTLQEAYKETGGFGKLQWFTTVILIIGFNTGGFLSYSMSFLELQPKYICTYPNGTDYSCTNSDFCGTNITYRIDYSDDTSLENWVEDLDLYCTPGAQIGLIGSMFFAGWAFSAFFLPRTADIFGRRIVYLYSMIGHMIFYGGILISRNIKLTTALQFFLGTASAGRASIGYLYMQELIQIEYQATAGTMLQVVNSSSTILSCIYFYFISKQWLWFQLFGWSLNVLTVVCVVFMPESPKFLLTKKRYDECRLVLTKMGQVNGIQGPFRKKFDKEVQSKTIGEVEQEEQQMTGGLKDIIRVRRHFINLIIMVSVWIASSFDYYLLNFQMKNIQGNIFLNTFTSSISELPAIILSGFMYKRIGMKLTLIIWFSLALVGGLCLIIFGDSYKNLIPVFVLFSKAGVTATFNLSYLANSQIFPAIFAGTAFGICNIGAKFTTILAPLMAEVKPPVPMILFCLSAGVAGFLSFLIKKDPEEALKKAQKTESD